MNAPRITLDQWRVFHTVVDQGGFARAARKLHRSQSSISYAMSRLQEQLGVRLMRIEGRKAVLTDAGEALLRRSRNLLRDAQGLETLAHGLEQGWEPEIRLVVDAAFPPDLLMCALGEFVPMSGGTRVQLEEVVLSGAEERLLEGDADLVIGVRVPVNQLGTLLVDVAFRAVAHPDHPLHRLNRNVTGNDLKHHLQVVVRDSGTHERTDIGWLGTDRRWTVTSLDTAQAAIRAGLGFGWLPEHRVAVALQEGTLKTLPLEPGGRYSASLHLMFRDEERAGPATQALAQLLINASRGGDSGASRTMPIDMGRPTASTRRATNGGAPLGESADNVAQ